jgi:hypothetical protein
MSICWPFFTTRPRKARSLTALWGAAFLLVATLLPCAAQDSTSPNLFTNADFSRGSQGWRLELVKPASATLDLLDVHAAPPEVAGRVASVNVTELGKERWHVQFYQTGLDLVEGEPYTLVFWARADRPRPISLNANVDVDDGHGIGLSLDNISITQRWRKYTYAFTPTSVVKGRCRITFLLGEARGAVSLAGLMLRRGKTTQEVGPNLLADGRFAEGTGAWRLENQAPADGTTIFVGGAAAPPGIASRVAHIDVKKVTDVNWHVQLLQDGLDLQQAETYTLSFWGRSDRVRPLTVTTTLDRPDWHWVGPAHKFTLGPDWRKLTATFTVAHTVKNHSRVSFQVGDQTGVVELADVTLRKEGARTAVGEGADSAPKQHPLIGTWESVGATPATKLVFTFNADGTGSIRNGAEVASIQGTPRTRVTNAFRWYIKTPDERAVMIGNEQYRWMVAGAGATQRLTLIDSKTKSHTLVKR